MIRLKQFAAGKKIQILLGPKNRGVLNQELDDMEKERNVKDMLRVFIIPIR